MTTIEHLAESVWADVIWPNVQHITLLAISENKVYNVVAYLKDPIMGRGLELCHDDVIQHIIDCALERLEFKGYNPVYDGTTIYLDRSLLE
jgi:hypothetical protein